MCQKIRDTRVGPPLLDQTGKQRKVIILHEHGGMFYVRHFFQHRVGELTFTSDRLPNPRRERLTVCAMWQSGQRPSLAKP